MADPYDELPAEMMADAELDAIPKDENHPFHDLTREEALEWRARYVAQRVDELKPKKSKNPSITDELGRSRRHKLLAQAYKNKCAAEHWSGQVEKEAKEQEAQILRQLGNKR